MAAATKPTKVYAWASGDAADVVEPTSGEIAQGWLPGTTPSAQYMNALMGGDAGTAPWLQYLQTFEQQALTWPERQTLQKGFAASGQRSTVQDGLDIAGGATVAGGLSADSATVDGALSADSATFASSSVADVSQVGTLKTANLAPATPAGTMTLPGNLTLTGPTATVTAPVVAGTLGNFSGDVNAATFRGNLEVSGVSAFGITAGVAFSGTWAQVTVGQSFYQVDRTGRLWIYLEDVYGGVVGSANPIFTLPVGKRPNYNYKFPTNRFVVSPTGTLMLYVTTGGSVYVQDSGGSLNGTTLASPGFTINASMIQIR